MPGPGTYQHRTRFEENVEKKRGTSLASRHNRRERQSTPGPGNYNPRVDARKKRGETYRYFFKFYKKNWK